MSQKAELIWKALLPQEMGVEGEAPLSQETGLPYELLLAL